MLIKVSAARLKTFFVVGFGMNFDDIDVVNHHLRFIFDCFEIVIMVMINANDDAEDDMLLRPILICKSCISQS